MIFLYFSVKMENKSIIFFISISADLRYENPRVFVQMRKLFCCLKPPSDFSKQRHFESKFEVYIPDYFVDKYLGDSRGTGTHLSAFHINTNRWICNDELFYII